MRHFLRGTFSAPFGSDHKRKRGKERRLEGKWEEEDLTGKSHQSLLLPVTEPTHRTNVLFEFWYRERGK